MNALFMPHVWTCSIWKICKAMYGVVSFVDLEIVGSEDYSVRLSTFYDDYTTYAIPAPCGCHNR